jgi:hypothetical protein
MTARLTVITRRRAALIAQAAAQRDEIGRVLQPWLTPLSFMDRGVSLLRRVRMHPFGVAMGVLMLFRLGRRGWSLWAGRLWSGWQLYQSLQNQQSRPRD